MRGTYVKLRLSLEVGRVKFSESTAVDEILLNKITITSNRDNYLIGQPSISYTQAKSSSIGDYMQLRLVDSSNEVFDRFS